MKRPNFVIYMPDEMRAQSIGCYGHPVVQTPNIDRLAAEGTRFDQCHVQHTVCSPSRCSMMTGWYPHVNGHRTLWHLLRPHEPHLFKYLAEAGYEIRWFGKNDLLSPDSFPGVVTEVKQAGPARTGVRQGGPGDPMYHTFLCDPYTGPPTEFKDVQNVTKAIEFLHSDPQDPFCLYLPLALPHPVYCAPEPWHDMYDPDELPPLRPVRGRGAPRYFEGIRRTRRLDELDDAVFRKINGVYSGMISFSDAQFGRLLRALDETGLARETVVLFLSDHGDWAGDYGLVEKWPSGLDDTLTRVPLIVRAPGGREGHVVSEIVELFDIMPTCLELAGISCAHTHFAQSLVPQLEGEPGDPERAAYCEGGYDIHEPHCFEGSTKDPFGNDPDHIYHPKGRLQQEDPASVCRSIMVRTATHKLIRRSTDIDELYDLQTDPLELKNVHGDEGYATVRQQLEERLFHKLLRTVDQVPYERSPRGVPHIGER